MGSYKWSHGVPLRVPLKGSVGILGFRGRGVISPLTWIMIMVSLLVAPIITAMNLQVVYTEAQRRMEPNHESKL